jgi:hypothetical protein
VEEGRIDSKTGIRKDVFGMIKSKRMRWTVNVAYIVLGNA